MFLRSGLLLACIAVVLQIAVYLQPLLPEKYHIAPVCMSITHNLIAPSLHHQNSLDHHNTQHSQDLNLLSIQQASSHHQYAHDMHHHQCQYCTVYGDIVMPPDLGVIEVMDRIHIRFVVFAKTFKHIYFELQRLFLMPQGRAPPIFL